MTEQTNKQIQATAKCQICGENATYSVMGGYCTHHWYKNFWLKDYDRNALLQVIASPVQEEELKAAQELLEELGDE